MKKATLIALLAVFSLVASGCFGVTDLDTTGTLSPLPDPSMVEVEIINDTASYVDIDVAQVGDCDRVAALTGYGTATGSVTIDSFTLEIDGVLCEKGAAPKLFDLDMPWAAEQPFGLWVARDDEGEIEYSFGFASLPGESEDEPRTTYLLVSDDRNRCSTSPCASVYLYVGVFTEGVTIESIGASIDQAVANGEISFWEGQALKQSLDVVQNLADLGLTQVADLVLTSLIRSTDFRSGDFYDNLGDQLSDWEPGQS